MMLDGDTIRAMFVTMIESMPDDRLGQAARGLPDEVLGSMMRIAVSATDEMKLAVVRVEVNERKPKRARKTSCEQPKRVRETSKLARTTSTKLVQTADSVDAEIFGKIRRILTSEGSATASRLNETLALKQRDLRKTLRVLLDGGVLVHSGSTTNSRWSLA
jgi:predicted HTH transcriptional regulator